MMTPLIAYGVLLDVQTLILLTIRMMVEFSTLCSTVDMEGWEERFGEATGAYEKANH